jgi:hypothetical protein
MIAFLVLLLVGHHALTRSGLLTAPQRPAGWPIQRHPRIAHLMPYPWSDSLRATTVAHHLGFRYVDKNGQADADHIVWIIHWSKIGKNGIRYIWTGGIEADGREIRRPLTALELDYQIDQCSTRFVARLRWRQHGGRRIHTAEAHMRRCADLGVVMCLEGKGTMNDAQAADYVVAAAVRTKVRLVFMTLQSIPGWRHRLDLYLDRATACALLPRGPRPQDWGVWRDRGVQRWGRWQP